MQIPAVTVTVIQLAELTPGHLSAHVILYDGDDEGRWVGLGDFVDDPRTVKPGRAAVLTPDSCRRLGLDH